jgi:hypothetical protein
MPFSCVRRLFKSGVKIDELFLEVFDLCSKDDFDCFYSILHIIFTPESQQYGVKSNSRNHLLHKITTVISSFLLKIYCSPVLTAELLHLVIKELLYPIS